MKKKLTKEQEVYIEEHYCSDQTWQIAEILNVTKKQVHTYAERHGLKKNDDYSVIRQNTKLTVEQREYILKNYSTMLNSEICETLGISKSDLRSFASGNKLKKKNKFYTDLVSKDIFGNVLSQELICKIVDDYPDIRNDELCEKYNITNSQCHSIANYYHLFKSKKAKTFTKREDGLTIEQKKYIIKNYPFMRTNDICKNLGLSYEQIHSYAQNRKLKKETVDASVTNAHYFDKLLQEKRIKTNRNKGLGTQLEPKVKDLYKSKYGKYFVNQNYFDAIDNEWKAYWLGFLYADGCNRISDNRGKMEYVLSISLASIDVEHLYKFANSIQTNVPIKQHSFILNNKVYYDDRINICNQRICESLNKMGCTPKKSLTLRFPNNDIVPDYLIRHFIRGYFDGDGCIHVSFKDKRASVSFVGTEDFLFELRKILCNALNITETVIQSKAGTKAKQISWGNIRSCELIFKYLYQDCNIYLNRKFEKFNTLYCLD